MPYRRLYHRRRMHGVLTVTVALFFALAQFGVAEMAGAKEGKDQPQGQSQAEAHGQGSKHDSEPDEQAGAAEGAKGQKPDASAKTASKTGSTTANAPTSVAAAAGGHISVDLIAAGPGTYNHATGIGGAYADRTISRDTGVVESLEGGDFNCGDLVVIFAAVTGGDDLTGTHEAQLVVSFLKEPTGQPGVGFVDIVSASLNTGDSGNENLDGNESVTLVSETSGTMGGKEALFGTVQVTNIDAGDQVIARVVARLGCMPGQEPTGNLQIALQGESPDAVINAGNQTIPLQHVEDIGRPGIGVEKTCPETAQVGASITYVITVTNLGSEALVQLTVRDSILGDLSASFADSLAVGASETHSFKYRVQASDPDPLVNTVTVRASGRGSGVALTATADCTTQIEGPAGNSGIQVVKNGPATVHVGDTITYSFDVRLTVDTPLTNVTLKDPICDPGTVALVTNGDGDDTLDSGEVWRFTCTHVLKAGDPDPLPNTVTVTGTDQSGAEVSDTDRHVIDIIHPGIEIVKTANPTSGVPGDVVTYTFAVTNTGDTILSDVTVDDDVIGHIGDIGRLEPGETVTLTATFRLGAAGVTNVGIARGSDQLGASVEDRDTAEVTVVLGETVTPPGGPGAGGPLGGLAFTGSSFLLTLAIAALALLMGLGLVSLARRFSTRAS